MLAEEGLAGLVEGPHGLGFAPAVAFAFVQMIDVRYVAAAQRGRDFLSLGRGHDLVVCTLEEGDRVAQLVGGVDRRAVAINISRFGQRADHGVEVAGFKFVGVRGEGEEVGHAVEADTSAEKSGPRGERPQDRVATGAAAHDDEALRVGEAVVDEVLGTADGVCHVEEAPLGAQGGHVGASMACAAAVIHVEDGPAARGKVLVAAFKAGLYLAGGAAVDGHDQRGPPPPAKAAAGRRVIEAEDAGGVFGLPGNGLWRGKVFRG